MTMCVPKPCLRLPSVVRTLDDRESVLKRLIDLYNVWDRP